jgi:alkylmercury lyase
MSTSFFDGLKTTFNDPETALEWKLLIRFWQMLAQSKKPVSLDALANALHRSRESVTAALEQVPEAEYDQSGNLAGLGLTLQPTVHQLILEGHPFYTWCGPDALLIPVALERPAQIVSTCPMTGTRIEVALTPEHLESLSPAGGVVSIAKDGKMVKKLEEAGCIRQECCDKQFFFASQEVVAPWLSEHADFIVVPVEEVFEGLREIALQQKALAARA